MSDLLSTPPMPVTAGLTGVETIYGDEDSFEVEMPDFHFPWLSKPSSGTNPQAPDAMRPVNRAPARLVKSSLASSSVHSSASSSHVLAMDSSGASWSTTSAMGTPPPLGSVSSNSEHGRRAASEQLEVEESVPSRELRSHPRVVSAPLPNHAEGWQATTAHLMSPTLPIGREDAVRGAKSTYVTPGLAQRTLAKSTASSARRLANPNLARFGGPARRLAAQLEPDGSEDGIAHTPPALSEDEENSQSNTAQSSTVRQEAASPARIPPLASPPDTGQRLPPPNPVPLSSSGRENRPAEVSAQVDEVDKRSHAGHPPLSKGPMTAPTLQASRHAPAPEPRYATVHKVEEDRPLVPASNQKRLFVVNENPYEKLAMLGKGGSSKVYSVMCLKRREVFALKRVTLDRADAETYQSYTNEIELLRRLRGHDRIIQLIDHQITFTSGNRPKLLLMVMECGEIDFAALLDEQREKPLNMSFVGLYWQQMLEAVQAVHKENVVHTDLKPANFVLVKGRLKIIDFGIAKAIANDTVNIQRDQQIGTVNYMSPEAIQKMNNQQVLKLSFPSDVWSLGCILYQMVYGNPPFHNIGGGPLMKMNKIADPNFIIDYPSAAMSRPTTGDPVSTVVPAKTVSIMRGCLEYNKDRRVTIPQLLQLDLTTPSRIPSGATLITKDQIAMLVNFVRRENGLRSLGPNDPTPAELFEQLEAQNSLHC